jgi:hypothetical protein
MDAVQRHQEYGIMTDRVRRATSTFNPNGAICSKKYSIFTSATQAVDEAPERPADQQDGQQKPRPAPGAATIRRDGFGRHATPEL